MPRTAKYPRQVILTLPQDLEDALEHLRREQQKVEGKEVTVAAMVRHLVRTHPLVVAYGEEHAAPADEP